MKRKSIKKKKHHFDKFLYNFIKLPSFKNFTNLQNKLDFNSIKNAITILILYAIDKSN